MTGPFDIVAVTDEGVVGDNRQAGVVRVLQGATIASLSTGARNKKSRSPRATIASSIGVCTVAFQFSGICTTSSLPPNAIDSLFCATLHGEVEGILHASQETNLAARAALGVGFTAAGGVDELGDLRVVHVVGGDDLVAGRDAGRNAGDTIQISHAMATAR